MTQTKALETIGGQLGNTSKMPGRSWGISAAECGVGSRLGKVKGSVCEGCYAVRGFYRFPSVEKSHARRLRRLEESLREDNGESWVRAMVKLLERESYFRFLDSGDLQGEGMLGCFVEVARRSPHCRFWLPTREYSIVKNWIKKNGAFPGNFTVRLSALMIDGPTPDAAARNLGVQVSGVARDGSHTCQAVKNDNQCGDCRKCWDPEVFSVTYKKH